MEGKVVEYKKSAKFLDVIEPPLRAKSNLMVLKTAIGKSTVNSKLLKWAFKGVVLPGLLYAASAWIKRTGQNGLQDRMRKLNRLAMNLIRGLIEAH